MPGQGLVPEREPEQGARARLSVRSLNAEKFAGIGQGAPNAG